MYYIYLIRKEKSNKTYLGYTSDLKRRLQEHRNQSTKMFSALKPDLIYYEAYKNKKDAQERERKLKQRGQSIRWLKARLKNSLK